MDQGFRTQVTNQPAPAIAGDFASLNPFWTVDAVPNGLVSGPLGVTVGRFCRATPPLRCRGDARRGTGSSKEGAPKPRLAARPASKTAAREPEARVREPRPPREFDA
jgi:hypothetical protein